MCELAATETSKWLMVDPWEATQTAYVPTAQVLDHFARELAAALDGGGVLSADGAGPVAPRIAVLAGADLVQTMSTPGVWAAADLAHILGRFSVFVVERESTDMDEALAGLPPRWRHNIHVIRQVFKNNMSSTQVRLHLKRNMSVRYLIPDCVIDYIGEEGLYLEDQGGKQLAELNGSRNGTREKQVVVLNGRQNGTQEVLAVEPNGTQNGTQEKQAVELNGAQNGTKNGLQEEKKDEELNGKQNGTENGLRDEKKDEEPNGTQNGSHEEEPVVE